MDSVVVMAGGRGSRLAARVGNRPKCLAQVAGAPFLFHLVNLYLGQGFQRVHLCLGVGADQVIRRVASQFDSVTYTIEDEPLGTAGCLRNALPALGANVIVVMGDSYTPEPIAPHFTNWVEHGPAAGMLVLENHDHLVPSNVQLSGSWVTRYRKHEQPMGWKHVDYGIYFFRREVIASLPDGFVDLGGVFETLVARRSLRAYLATEPFWEIGTPAALDRAELAVADGMLCL